MGRREPGRKRGKRLCGRAKVLFRSISEGEYAGFRLCDLPMIVSLRCLYFLFKWSLIWDHDPLNITKRKKNEWAKSHQSRCMCLANNVAYSCPWPEPQAIMWCIKRKQVAQAFSCSALYIKFMSWTWNIIFRASRCPVLSHRVVGTFPP